ncbi:liver-expressed antimicrobial peptide 2 [Brachionichthys hirsutus]|uniref:liver-expressed antimicrobial peptide 2 n=1 Tax=Brachionichthys hirsutus TaxID=412623 RepID=UPI0036043C0D
MREKAFVLCVLLLMTAQQVCAGPLVPGVQSGPDRRADSVQVLRRAARMTPLWRIMNSKPFGAYCQNNYECSTGLCREGHCATSYRAPPEPVLY